MKPYRSDQWRIFRLQVIRADGGVCCRCGRDESDGAVLQVHHTRYISGRLPWEYELSDCETLCQGCHAIEHGIIPPQSGWEWVGWDDLGDPSGNCDACDTTIRYTYLITHSKWHHLVVGSECCDRLVGNRAASEHQRTQQSYAGMLRRFLKSKRWTALWDGTLQITRRGHYVNVIPMGAEYALRIDRYYGRRRYPSAEKAKMAAFEVIESGAFDEYLEKQRISVRGTRRS